MPDVDKGNTTTRYKQFNKQWGNIARLSTLNVRSFGYKKEDREYYYSYCKSLNHDAFCATETWNSHRHFESWDCVASAENLSGVDKAAGVCIILSRRFASLQMNRGKLGKRGCWVRIRGPVCNLLIIGIYIPSEWTRASTIELIRMLMELLRE